MGLDLGTLGECWVVLEVEVGILFLLVQGVFHHYEFVIVSSWLDCQYLVDCYHLHELLQMASRFLLDNMVV